MSCLNTQDRELTLQSLCIASSHQNPKKEENMRNKIEQLKKKGQGLVEYALILVLIAIVVILILTFLGNQVNTTFSKIGSGLR
jgi:pilus assembly protein Flp/PilA